MVRPASGPAVTPGIVRLALIVALVGSLAALPLLLTRALPQAPPPPVAVPVAGIAPAAAEPVPDSALANLIARTPFRAGRAPAAVRYDPEGPKAPVATPSAGPVRPSLVLTGIIWEEEPAAVVEGLPGTDGPRVVRPNDVIGSLRVRRIGQQQVVIGGEDTTWTLRVREPWK